MKARRMIIFEAGRRSGNGHGLSEVFSKIGRRGCKWGSFRLELMKHRMMVSLPLPRGGGVNQHYQRIYGKMTLLSCLLMMPLESRRTKCFVLGIDVRRLVRVVPDFCYDVPQGFRSVTNQYLRIVGHPRRPRHNDRFGAGKWEMGNGNRIRSGEHRMALGFDARNHPDTRFRLSLAEYHLAQRSDPNVAYVAEVSKVIVGKRGESDEDIVNRAYHLSSRVFLI